MHVDIGGLHIPVILKNKKEMKNDHAFFCAESESIHIHRNLDVEMRRKTLAHECYHAFLFVTGYNELLNEISSNLEEAMTRAFEQALGNYFVFNQDIEDWIEGK